jgi:transposase-like protein
MWITFFNEVIMRRLTTEERRRRRFTEAFKQEQVDLIRRGESTVAEVARMYQVKAENVSRWVHKYAQGDVREGIVIGSRSDYDHAKALEKENQSLKQCIGEQHMRIVYMEQMLALAKERLGKDFEKK